MITSYMIGIIVNVKKMTLQNKIIKRRRYIMEKCYNFEVAHGYEILKGYVYAVSKEKAIEMIKDEDWDDVIDVYDSDA